VSRPSWDERTVVALLRLGGVLTCCAFPAALLPAEWMAAVHAALGMGPLPRAPIVDYLARSLSLLYGFHGVFLLLVSTDVRRYRALVVLAAWMDVVGGVALFAIDVRAGMPPWWTWGEGPPLLAFGLVLLWLVHRTSERASAGPARG
jgi:hypothetical protein